MPFLHHLGLNCTSRGFCAVHRRAAALLFAVTPLLQLSLSKSGEGLAEGSRGSAGTTLAPPRLQTHRPRAGDCDGAARRRRIARQEPVSLAHRGSRSWSRTPRDAHVAAPSDVCHGPTARGAASPDARPCCDSAGCQSGRALEHGPLSGGNTMWIRVLGRPHNGEHNEVNYREVSGRILHHARGPPGARAILHDRRRCVEAAGGDHQPGVVRQDFPGEEPLAGQDSIRADVHAAAHADRGHRGGHQGRSPGHGDPADDLRRVRAGPEQRLRPRRANVAGGGSAAAVGRRRRSTKSIPGLRRRCPAP